MTRDVECAACTKTFAAKAHNAKYCSPACRQRGHRSPGGRTKTTGAGAPGSAPAPVLKVSLSVALELGKLGVTEGADAARALHLATQMEHPMQTGAAVASLDKQLGAVMDAIRAKAKPVTQSRLDELKERRDAKRTG